MNLRSVALNCPLDFYVWLRGLVFCFEEKVRTGSLTRANGYKQHSKAEPQGQLAQHDEVHPNHYGIVNAVVVQRKIMFLPKDLSA